MGERHVIAGAPRGEPLPAGDVGIRVRIPLSGTPSPHWAELFTSALTQGLIRHPGASRVRLKRVVQGGELVLEGVQDANAGELGSALRAAVGSANARSDRPAAKAGPCNVDQEEADRIAAALDLHDDREAPELGAGRDR